MQNFPLNPLTLPIWWYSAGLQAAWQWTKRKYFFGLHKSGILIFSRHLGEPLYGDYTRTGRIISFFIRIILLVYKLLALGVRILFLAIFNLIFLLLLPATVILVILNIFAVKFPL